MSAEEGLVSDNVNKNLEDGQNTDNSNKTKLDTDAEKPIDGKSEIELKVIEDVVKTKENEDSDDSQPSEPKKLKINDDKTEKSDDSEDETSSNSKCLVSVEEKPLRKFQRIPIFIVDYHNDVLNFLYRCFASRHLPLKNNILVHFDSHPDMVISRELPAEYAYDKNTVLDSLSIENWIMPMCFAGHFNRVIWLKNSWCDQIPLGSYDFKIGEKDEYISVDLPLSYFISEGNYCKTEELINTRDIHLEVHNIDIDETDPKNFLKEEDTPNFVLDIDLDFFSTTNPFLQIYSEANCYEHLKEIFDFTCDPDDLPNAAEQRKKQLTALKEVFVQLHEKRCFRDVLHPEDTILSEEVVNRIEMLADQLKQNYSEEEIDWLLIYDSGSTVDTNGLPHHISTPAELELYYKRFKEFLQKLPIPPVAITIACSAEDDYCPQDQVNVIEQKVLEILGEVFGEKISECPILYYMNDTWDVMKM